MEHADNPERLEPAGLSVAMDSVRTAVTHVIKLADDGGLNDFDTAGLMQLLRDFQGVLNLLPVFDQMLIQHCVEQRVAEDLCFRNLRAVMVSALQLSPGEAGRRVKAAGRFADRHTMVGEVLPAYWPQIAEAQRTGGLNPEQARVIADALEKVDGAGFDPVDVTAGEQILVQAAGHTGPTDLKVLGQRVVEAIDPDGTLPDDQVQAERRYLRLSQLHDGSWCGEFRLTDLVGQKLRTVLDALSQPNITRCSTVTTPTNSDQADSDLDTSQGQSTGVKVIPDERSFQQRQHDALELVLDRMLRSDDLPDVGGVPATIIITIDQQNLVTGRGAGRYADGSLTTAKTVAQLTNEAEIVEVHKTANGAILDLGRTRRLASRNQTLALIARDGGCSFPNCTIQPQWCQRHHIIEWQHGGPTDLDNLTLLCPYHHHHFQQYGWTCELNTDRLPVWIPPKWINPGRTPILHPRIQTINWKPPRT